MIKSIGTSIASQFGNSILNTAQINVHTSITTNASLRGSSDTNGYDKKITQNDIICGRSFCASNTQPTWQFCS